MIVRCISRMSCLLGVWPAETSGPRRDFKQPDSRVFMVRHDEYPSERCAGCLGVIDSGDATENLRFCWNCLNYIWEVV